MKTSARCLQAWCTNQFALNPWFTVITLSIFISLPASIYYFLILVIFLCLERLVRVSRHGELFLRAAFKRNWRDNETVINIYTTWYLILRLRELRSTKRESIIP